MIFKQIKLNIFFKVDRVLTDLNNEEHEAPSSHETEEREMQETNCVEYLLKQWNLDRLIPIFAGNFKNINFLIKFL